MIELTGQSVELQIANRGFAFAALKKEFVVEGPRKVWLLAVAGGGVGGMARCGWWRWWGGDDGGWVVRTVDLFCVMWAASFHVDVLCCDGSMCACALSERVSE